MALNYNELGKIGLFLFIQCVKLLTCEALTWFSVQDLKTQDKDQFDIRECFTSTDNYNWWKFKDGWIFFWVWSAL